MDNTCVHTKLSSVLWHGLRYIDTEKWIIKEEWGEWFELSFCFTFLSRTSMVLSDNMQRNIYLYFQYLEFLETTLLFNDPKQRNVTKN
jgi:hypothetical protein